jgi:hypothetical protein
LRAEGAVLRTAAGLGGDDRLDVYRVAAVLDAYSVCQIGKVAEPLIA